MAKQELDIAGAKKQVTITPFEHHTKYHETDLQGIIHTSNYLNWIIPNPHLLISNYF